MVQSTCTGMASQRLATPRMALLGLVLGLAAALAGAPSAKAAGGSGELKIGLTQFPSTLHPNIDSMLAKNYVLAMTARPITAFDQEWQLICMMKDESDGG